MSVSTEHVEPLNGMAWHSTAWLTAPQHNTPGALFVLLTNAPTQLLRGGSQDDLERGLSPLAPGDTQLEDYQSSLEEVLTWLLSAEDGLQAQPPISSHVEEGYMVELTSHQGSVGRVLRAGSALLGEGRLTEEEEKEVREQMNLLNSRWEHLRVASMERQSR
ncbi:unnamed protein product [Coregonus sp. 'balchen']|nr:unnamed protein product [Coregonus sp. 'balchen']